MKNLLERPELLTPREMGQADRMTIEAGTLGIVLMERAGAAVAATAERLARARGRVKILCGPGGNGGDGFIAGRLLREHGYRVELFLMGEVAGLTGDPALAAQRCAGPVLPAEAFDPSGADLVIDALYGAGLARDLDGVSREAVEKINTHAERGGRVLAVDVPSGVDGETGAIRGVAVRADATVTFHRFKPGHLLLPARKNCGALEVADIGISASPPVLAWANSPIVWRDVFPVPGAASHKYSRGVALALSGGPHSTGAARLAARAALRVGAGLVALASPLESVAVNAAHLTALMIEPFDGLEGFCRLLADARRNAILLGPGAGVTPRTREWVEATFTQRAEKPRAIVLDADAISVFAGDSASLAELVARRGLETVLTPHEGEFARLFRGAEAIERAPSKLERARAAAKRLGAVVAYKGADTVVAAPDGRATIGWDLPPTLATAGSGDTLAGFVTGLLAQKMPAFEAASAAVWLHGACARALGPGLIAEDLCEALPGVLRAMFGGG